MESTEKRVPIHGVDLPIEDLVPIRERRIKFHSNKGFSKIVASIQAVGLIEPLAVYREDDKYVILDGFLRYKACQKLGIKSIPCMMYENKEAYTFNRMVNRLSPVQEMKMLRKALSTIDEDKIAETFGLQSIKHRLGDRLIKHLHPRVIKALDNNQITRNCAKDFIYVTHERQLQILKEMERINDFSSSFVQALVLKTPEEMRNPEKRKSTRWSHDPKKKKKLVHKLQEIEKRHDFYRNLYQQYTTDLLKMTIFVRKLITNDSIKTALAMQFSEILTRFEDIVFESNDAPPSEPVSVA